MLVLKLLGFQSGLGLVLALLRDVRRLFWVGVGLLLFFISGVRRFSGIAGLQRISKS
jgi:hypothetical protein